MSLWLLYTRQYCPLSSFHNSSRSVSYTQDFSWDSADNGLRVNLTLTPVYMGVGSIFIRGALEDFSKIFVGVQKRWNFFFPLETRKQPDLLTFLKSGGPSLPYLLFWHPCLCIRGWLTRWPPRSFANPIWHSAPLCLHWSTIVPLCFHLL